MATYSVNVTLTTPDAIEVAVQRLVTVVKHMPGWGNTLSALTVPTTGNTKNQFTFTITPDLTPEQVAHLGL